MEISFDSNDLKLPQVIVSNRAVQLLLKNTDFRIQAKMKFSSQKPQIWDKPLRLKYYGKVEIHSFDENPISPC